MVIRRRAHIRVKVVANFLDRLYLFNLIQCITRLGLQSFLRFFTLLSFPEGSFKFLIDFCFDL